MFSLLVLVLNNDKFSSFSFLPSKIFNEKHCDPASNAFKSIGLLTIHVEKLFLDPTPLVTIAKFLVFESGNILFCK